MQHFRSPDIGMFGRRQRHVRGHRSPVAIVADFSGPPDSDVAVVVDTFGAGDIAPLGTECQCCTVRVELQASLRRLLAERAQRHFARVVIETREDLMPILRTFATARALGADFYVEVDPGIDLDGTRSFALTEDAPLSWDAFSRFITALQALRGADLLRVKGLLNVVGCRGPVVVHVMQHVALPPVELQSWPDDNRQSRLEFMTRDIEEGAVRIMLNAVRALT